MRGARTAAMNSRGDAIRALALVFLGRARRLLCRVLEAPARALALPVGDLPLRMDAINTAARARRRLARNVFDFRAVWKMLLMLPVPPAARRRTIANIVGEQPRAESIVYFFRYAGGRVAAARNAAGGLAPGGGHGPGAARLLSAVADGRDVTAHLAPFAQILRSDPVTMREVGAMLAYRGARPAKREVRAMFSDLACVELFAD